MTTDFKQQNKTMLQQISDAAWLVSRGNQRIGLLNKDVQEHYTFMSGKELVNFNNDQEVINHFGNIDLFNQQIAEPITNQEKIFIKGFEVSRAATPWILESTHEDYRPDIPLYSKIEGSRVYYAAGNYVVRFPKDWKNANCPKLSTMLKYGYEGPFKTMSEARQRMRELNKQIKND